MALVALGWILQPRLKLDVGTLNRLQVYVVMPAFLVHFLSSGKQPISVVWPVAWFGIALFMILIPLGWLTALAFRQRPGLGWALAAGAGIGLMAATKETFVINLGAAAVALVGNALWRVRLDASGPGRPIRWNWAHLAGAVAAGHGLLNW